jgi:hypothetical protein
VSEWPDPVVDAGDDHTEDFTDMTAALEPVAVANRPDHDGMIRLSTAISLKRIADALATLSTEGCNHYGETFLPALTRAISDGIAGR